VKKRKERENRRREWRGKGGVRVGRDREGEKKVEEGKGEK